MSDPAQPLNDDDKIEIAPLTSDPRTTRLKGAALILIFLVALGLLIAVIATFIRTSRNTVSTPEPTATVAPVPTVAQVAPQEQPTLAPTNPPTPQPTAVVAQTTVITYVVKPGDVMGSIALKFAVSEGEIAQANGISNTNQIRIGQALRIPFKGSEADAATALAAADQQGGPTATPPILLKGGRQYRVLEGESLWVISQRFRVPIDALMLANKLSDPGSIRAGELITIPVVATPIPSPRPTRTPLPTKKP